MIDIKHLSKLSRIGIDEREEENYAKNIEKILSFVGVISQGTLEANKPERALNDNTLRDDVPTSSDTQILRDAFPGQEKDFLVSKKIL